ncbi:MAG: hypothetical protein HYR96_13460 [Deltaproteobacteria bacterium]|nr:hypothetical protein [Deltaproteobacteria bacterium]MBI3295588.1 hypothetical protein [Deltaproteobacteria bacterium]
MKIRPHFPTLIATGRLPGGAALNGKLMKDIREFSRSDRMGREWSRENYVGGYTSYASLSDLHHRTPSFQELEKRLTPLVAQFGKANGFSARGMEWKMTACWASVMGEGTHHTLHLHPHSTVSGVYYVSVPPGSAPLKIEDPRMASFMAAPVRELYELIDPRAGEFVLFESWVRHEVPVNRSKTERICVSFNYSWEQPEI